MKLYADYNFYQTEYGGTFTKEEFNKHILKASAHVRRITFGRADNFIDMEEVKYAACAVCDVLISGYRDRKSNNGKQIASENTDGYSVSYVQEKASDETLEELQNRKAYKAAEIYLEPIGLLYLGVDE